MHDIYLYLLHEFLNIWEIFMNFNISIIKKNVQKKSAVTLRWKSAQANNWDIGGGGEENENTCKVIHTDNSAFRHLMFSALNSNN